MVAANKLMIHIDIEIDVAHMQTALNEAHLNTANKTKEQVVVLNENIKQAMRDLITIGRSRL